MATNNAVNTSLSGQTGTGNFVGAVAPTISLPTIVDANGNNEMVFSTTASAVNYLSIANNGTGFAPVIGAVGSDANVSLNLFAKAAGAISINSTATTPVIFLSGTGYQHLTQFTFANTAANRTVTWPDAAGTVALETDSTFVPVVSFGGASVGITYTTRVGIYSLIGNTVTFSISITLSSKGSSTGNVNISGLPFAARASAGSISPFASYLASVTSTGPVSCITAASSATISMVGTNILTGAVTLLADTNFTNA